MQGAYSKLLRTFCIELAPLMRLHFHARSSEVTSIFVMLQPCWANSCPHCSCKAMRDRVPSWTRSPAYACSLVLIYAGLAHAVNYKGQKNSLSSHVQKAVGYGWFQQDQKQQQEHEGGSIDQRRPPSWRWTKWRHAICWFQLGHS